MTHVNLEAFTIGAALVIKDETTFQLLGQIVHLVLYLAPH